jgi:hypothetical protein
LVQIALDELVNELRIRRPDASDETLCYIADIAAEKVIRRRGLNVANHNFDRRQRAAKNAKVECSPGDSPDNGLLLQRDLGQVGTRTPIDLDAVIGNKDSHMRYRQ